jgi:hypothetical protein
VLSEAGAAVLNASEKQGREVGGKVTTSLIIVTL